MVAIAKKKKRVLITREDLIKLSHPYQVRFACFCARQVLHLVKEKDHAVCNTAIITAEKWLVGEVTIEECRLASATAAAYAHDVTYAAYAVAYAANAANAYATYAVAYAVTYAAANAATTASAAAYATASAASAYAASASATNVVATATYAAFPTKERQKLIDEQWDLYEDLLNIDKCLEDAVGLGEEG